MIAHTGDTTGRIELGTVYTIRDNTNKRPITFNVDHQGTAGVTFTCILHTIPVTITQSRLRNNYFVVSSFRIRFLQTPCLMIGTVVDCNLAGNFLVFGSVLSVEEKKTNVDLSRKPTERKIMIKMI